MTNIPPTEPQNPIDMDNIIKTAARDTAHEIRDLVFAKDTAYESDAAVSKKIDENSRFTPSFLLLLIGASIVCTLGLLMNSPAIIIGGMIISPIMWPLMKVSLGVSFEKSSYIWRAVAILVFSVLLALFSSAFITMLSPLKAIDSEILARTNPNLLDIIIALVAGFVAALGMIKPRISESLAGVAIATSLMPPLCVAGIGIALLNGSISLAGLYLFIENAVTIVFVATLVFIYYSRINKRMSEFRKKGLITLAVLMMFISIPSLVLLVKYSTQVQIYAQVQQAITDEFASISSNIIVDQAKVTIGTDNTLAVTVTALVPQGQVITYADKERMTKDLEKLTSHPVDLAILLQVTLPVSAN
jgi:uncharacterized hydrophobic protein (TIGR00271 family)